MGKPRIVIADADEAYIAPLQQKFIEAFFDKIDLEIITEEECFRSLFSAPQKMDILVVSEAFYSIELQRHNIENIFLMTEQSSDGQTSDLLVNKIFKYAKNVKEIFHEIIGSSSDSLRAKTEIKKQTQTILVTAASGGAGKTTIALGMAACLAQAHKRVLYIDADLYRIFVLFDNTTPGSQMN